MTKNLQVAILMITGLLAAGAGQTQEPKIEAPKPAPETKRLDYFTGNWHSEAEMKPGPWGAGQKWSSDLRCSWMEGGFFVVSNESGQWSLGKMASTGVMGYDPEAKVYTWDGFNSVGGKSHATGSVEGKTWTFNSENEVNGKAIKARTLIFEESPTGYRFTVEMSEDGGKTWSASVMEVKMTKTGPAEKR